MNQVPTLDPVLAAVLAADLRTFGPREPLSRANLEAQRADYLRRRMPRAAGGPAMRESRTETLTAPGREIRVRLHVPADAPATGPALFYFNGGGWVWGSIDSHDRIMRELSGRSGCRVVGVDYRKAPEAPFPAPFEDCLDGVRAVLARAGSFGIDPSRIAFGGDSAGGNLALACGLAAEPVPSTLLLLYGAFDTELETGSYRAPFGDGSFGLSRADMALFLDWYLPSATMRRDPRAAPLHGVLARLRDVFILGAGLDPLRDDSRNLAGRLASSGVDHEFVELAGANHGFLHLVGDVPLADAAIDRAAAHLRRVLAG
ncbi:MAG: alpha/beta hydrolase [Alphaproteobacteria bacterium]|nr:alpha/beta hydrolase [Alphaproteobacteria bacterium]